MDWADLLIKVIPNWLGDSLHSFVDVIVKVTPNLGGVVGLSQLLVMAGFALVLFMGWEHLGCDIKDD